jgi:hypothetical protein
MLYISIWFGCYKPPGIDSLPPNGHVLSAWCPPWTPCKTIEFQPYLPDPQKLEKVIPRAPKSYQKDIQKTIGLHTVH